MKQLIIVGAGGFGREVYSYALYVQAVRKDWEILGFIDDNLEALSGYTRRPPIIGKICDYQPKDEEIFTLGLGLPTSQKLALVKNLQEKGAQFISLIHPYAGINVFATVGRGCVIAPWASLSSDVNIEDFVVINAYASVGHDSVIEEGCTIGPYASIAGNVRIERGVSIGIHACVLPGVEIKEFATVGAGSVVVKSVKPHTTVMGVPAKKIL